MNLVVGATGLLGGNVCERLKAAGQPVKALVRADSDPGKVKTLVDAGIETVVGDLKDKVSLEQAFAGIETVISTASSTFSRRDGDTIQTVDRDGQINAVVAASEAGVGHFVFISFREDPKSQYALSQAKRAVEDRIKQIGMKYTIIQASWFMEVWFSAAVGFDYANASARIYGDGTNPVSYVSYQDVAKMCVAAVQNDALVNKVIEFGGPEKIAPNDVVKIFEEASGKSFAVEHVPETDLAGQREQATDPLSESFAGLMLQCAHGDAIDMDATVRTFDLQLTSVREYAKSVLS